MFKKKDYKKISSKIFKKNNIKFINKNYSANKSFYKLKKNNNNSSYILKNENLTFKNSTSAISKGNELQNINTNVYLDVKSNLSNYKVLANNIEINHIYNTCYSNSNLILQNFKIKVLNLTNKIEKEYINNIKYNNKYINNRVIIEEILKEYNEIVFEIMKHFKSKEENFYSNSIEILWNFLIFIFDKINKINDDYNTSLMDKFLHKKYENFEKILIKKNWKIKKLKQDLEEKDKKFNNLNTKYNEIESLYYSIKEELNEYESTLKNKLNQDPWKIIENLINNSNKLESKLNKSIKENLTQTKIVSSDFAQIIRFASKKNFFQANKETQTQLSFSSKNFYYYNFNVFNWFDNPNILIENKNFNFMKCFNFKFQSTKIFSSKDIKNIWEQNFDKCILIRFKR